MQTIIGWTGVLVAGGALISCGFGFVALRRLDPRFRVRPRPVRTVYLLSMWVLLLVGSAGLLAGARWAEPALRGWAAMVAGWTLLYVGANLNSVRGMDEVLPGAFRSAAVGSAVVLLLVGGAIALLLVGLSRIPA